MSLYFFHLCAGADTLVDEEGREFGDDAAIRTAALADARSIISDGARSGLIDLSLRIDVEDDLRALVHSIGFHEAVRIIPAVQV